MKARLTKYGLCALFVAVMAYAYLLSRDFAGAGNRERYQLLCDALTVPGVLLVCAGALGKLLRHCLDIVCRQAVHQRIDDQHDAEENHD